MANYAPIDLAPYDLRIAMIRNGYHPTPLDGKRPRVPGWQAVFATEETANQWRGLGKNTGGLTKFTPALDIDIRDETAAQIVEDVARSYLQGQILVRMGQAPKRAMLLRTDAPFPKIIRKFTAPDGTSHKIEVLGDGQQLVVGGDHPDTGLPYAWQDSKSPANTPRDQLPLAEDVETILDLCAAELKEKLGWGEHVSSTADAPDFEFDERPPLDERIKATAYKGEFGINQAILELPIDRLSDGISVDGVIAECEELVRAAWEKLDDEHPDKDRWDWAAQHRQIEDSVYGFIRKTCGENARLIEALPNDLLAKWREIEQRGGSPGLYKKRGLGRGAWSVKDFGPAEEIPTVDPEEIPTQPAPEPGERKLRFRLISFQDMRPGVEPSYLVDELIPSAGLVLVWGKQKTFKSFWLLDLMLHVALGLSYRDYAVRQGLVVYCAFEGGHGYKGRIEAMRRHYNIADDVDVPLYVMPGQVDLIADSKALVGEFQHQLGERIPAVVVLDTLNRSCPGRN